MLKELSDLIQKYTLQSEEAEKYYKEVKGDWECDIGAAMKCELLSEILKDLGTLTGKLSKSRNW